MLGGLADIPPLSQDHLRRADRYCAQLLKDKNDGEEEEIVRYKNIIEESLEDLKADIKEWRMEEGLYASSSDEELDCFPTLTVDVDTKSKGKLEEQQSSPRDCDEVCVGVR